MTRFRSLLPERRRTVHENKTTVRFGCRSCCYRVCRFRPGGLVGEHLARTARSSLESARRGGRTALSATAGVLPAGCHSARTGRVPADAAAVPSGVVWVPPLRPSWESGLRS